MMRGRERSSARRVDRFTAGLRTRLLVLFTGLSLVALVGMPAGANAQSGTGQSPAARPGVLAGPIDRLPAEGLIGDWIVLGTTVHVTPQTMVDQTLAVAKVGRVANVQGTWQADGSIVATKVKIEIKGFVGPPATAPVTLSGAVGALPATQGWVGDWTVAGATVHVSAATAIDQTGGAVAVGAAVLVRGTQRADRSVDAASVRVLNSAGGSARTVTFCGPVSALPTSGLVGDWTVDGLRVHVDASTAIDQTGGAVALNVSVRVTGTIQPDASINATAIVVSSGQCGAFNQPTSLRFSILHLTPTADAPEGAEGVVLTRAMTFADASTREDLKVAVEHLLPDTAYEVMIDAVDAGPIMTNDRGEGMLFLSTAEIPGAEPLPPDLQDFSTFVRANVFDSKGTAMLTGEFANAKTTDRQHPGFDYLGVAILRDQSSLAVGMATATIKGTIQDLAVAAWGLVPNQTYTLVIDGTAVGNLTATARGRIQVEYSSTPIGQELQLPDSLVPVSGLMAIELQDSAAATVASGDFQSLATPASAVVRRIVKRAIHR